MADSLPPQYQHFVPQFLIRNFSHPFKPPTSGRKKSQRPKRKPINGMYPNDPVVHNLDLSMDPPVFCEAPVNRIFGRMDMYRDTSKPSAEQQQIEQMFSRIENQASRLFRQITKSFDLKEKGLWITREERDLLRKFLFLLKYRGIRFHRRFYHENAETYDSDDRYLLHDYMVEKGYKRPMDVWLDNLKTLIELHMDPEGNWMLDLPKRMFPMDANWFIAHVQHMYMAICAPSNCTDEFILTENSYNIFEGPNYFVPNLDSGKFEMSSWTSFHEFAPISPKLIIVLRSFLLPVPEEDADPAMMDLRERFRLAVESIHKEKVTSLLADLPIKKARNNYSTIRNGRVQLNYGENWTKSKNDKFCFDYFPISTAHVQTINEIFLDNSYLNSRLVFETKDTFSRTLEAYLTSPTGKLVRGDDTDLRLALLQKLAAVLKSLGSDSIPVWREENNPELKDYWKFKAEEKQILRNIFNDRLTEKSSAEFIQVYKSLGGSEETLMQDIRQSGLMWTLRVKIDVWSKGVPEAIRQHNRRLLISYYLRLPPHRVWMFVKYMRLELLQKATQLETTSDLFGYESLLDEGPEDTLAKGKYSSLASTNGLLTKVATNIINDKMLRRLMYRAVINESKMNWKSGSSLWANINNPNLHLFERAMALRVLFSLENGYIRDCGINEIEQLARKQELEVLRSGQLLLITPRYPMFKDDEIVEILTRLRVKSKFLDVLSGKLDSSLLQALKEVFFEILYPTPE